ncbi:hypothetical protein G6F57_014006 [Rhizopus arrhizus]|nr:hypothetical protein G6F23_011430 [Rhizopus arrhizus]KAG0753800.1 hypothetical protein G6F24_012783 [Rhizopus arrhizus]KAG0774816.1 hypothetical protein G6F22_013771 [Rhizopus arrhizus]KAG0778780.1 hypothetical protein G6F21_012845 [Rhizopus arrhizus]KAG0804684.1 hypothetical protein G6F20_012504 [Rhizopus arrhizus]
MTELHNNTIYYPSLDWFEREEDDNNSSQAVGRLPPIHQMNHETASIDSRHPKAWKEIEPTPSPSASTEFTSSSQRSRKRGTPSTKDIHVEKNTEGKPPYSYATLIKYAIENSEKKKLTLSEIYQWVIEHYPYYSSAGTGWKNSIRHNLSLNKSFVRVPRPVNEPGKGSYWQVDNRLSDSDPRTKITIRHRGSRSGSDPVKAPYLPEEHQRFHRDSRSLSLDSNMSAKLNAVSFYPAPFSSFAYDNRPHHHHHHHHHHRHSVDFSRNSPYLTNYELYSPATLDGSPYSSLSRIQSKHNPPPTPSSTTSFYPPPVYSTHSLVKEKENLIHKTDSNQKQSVRDSEPYDGWM